jgi:D-alanyl-D-alanine carboxypeptidase
MSGSRGLLAAGAALAVLVSAALPGRASVDGPQLLADVDHIRSQQPFSGSLLVVRDGRVFAARSYGYADRAGHRRARLETRYRISGLTVAFTWIGLLQLRDAHRLELDASICRAFRPCPQAWRPLTPRHLAGPSTGLRALPRSAFARWPPTLARYVDRLRRERLYFKPGTLVAHNTSKYYGGDSPTILAARLLEVASGQRWADYVRRHILEPAGMTSTGFERSKRDAVGYGRNREHAVVARPLPAPNLVPDVKLGLWSTVRDFARLDAALRAGKLLSGESLSELDTPALPNDRRRGRGWGCCWLVTEQFGHAAEVHGAHGFGDGFYAAFERYPEDGVLVLVFTNFGGSGPAFSIADLAASLALGDYPSGVEVDAAALRQLAGVFEYRQQRGARVFSARMTLKVVRGKLQVAKTSAGLELLGPLLPRSESAFVAQYAPAWELEFTRGPDGLPTALLLRDVNAGWRMEFLPVRSSP